MSRISEILTSKPIKILAVLIVLFVLVIRISTYFMGAEKYRQAIITEISNYTGDQKVTIDGKLTFTSTPILNTAYINIPNISINNINDSTSEPILRAKTTIIQVSLMEFFFGKINFKGVEIQDAHINLERMPNKQLNWGFLNDLNDKKYDSLNLNLITFNNTSLSVKDSILQADYSNINITISLENKDNIAITGNFQNTGQNLNIDALISKALHEKSRDAQIHLNNDAIDANINAKIINQSDNFEINSNIKLNLSKPVFIMNYLIKAFPSLKSIVPREFFNDQLHISGDLLINDAFLQASNVNIDSKQTKGTASIKNSFNENKNIEMEFNFEILDINNFISFDDTNMIQNFTNNTFNNKNTSEDYSYINFTLIDTENVNINFNAKQILIHNLEVQNMNLDFATRSGSVNQGNLALEIKNKDMKTAFKLKNLTFRKVDNLHVLVGELYNNGKNINDTLNMFDLQEYININDKALQYSIYSKIVLSPKELSIFEIDGKIGEAGNFTGSIASTHDELNHYNFDLKFNDLKLVNFDMPLVKERLSTLLTKSGSDDYLSYFRWFRTLSSSYRFKLEFINTELKNEKIDNLKTVCKLSPGNMSFLLNLQSDFADGAYQIDIDATKLQPTLNIVVNSLNIDFNRVKPLIAGLVNDNNTSNNTAEATQTNQNIWSDTKFNLFRIYKYATKLDISVKNLLLAKHNFEMFRFIGHTSTNILYVDNLYFKIYGGQFQAQGNLSFFDQLLGQLSFVTSDMEISELLSDTFPTLNNISGIFSATGSIVSQGDSMKSMIANLSTSTNFAAAQISLNGVDSDAIVDLALQRKPVDKSKALDLMNGFLNSGKIDITNINGNLKATNGVLTSSNTAFKTRFSNAAFAMSLDLNNLTFSSNTGFSFAPYLAKNAISYQIIESGSLLQPTLTKTINNKELTKYIKRQYGIVTEQDILEAQERLEEQQRALAIDPDSKDYLYYKLQQQDADKVKPEDVIAIPKTSTTSVISIPTSSNNDQKNPIGDSVSK